MTVLKTLTLSDHAPKKAKIDPVVRSRSKFVAALEQQISIVQAQAKNETFTVERMRWKTNDDGERVRVPAQIEPRPWFWDEDGTIFLMPKVGVRPLEIEKGKPTIKVGAIKELVPTLQMLIAATEAGELDQQIAASNARTSK